MLLLLLSVVVGDGDEGWDGVTKMDVDSSLLESGFTPLSGHTH
jgi:hypothetical protein